MDGIHLYPHVPAVQKPECAPGPPQASRTAGSELAFSEVLARELGQPAWQTPRLPADFPLKLSSHAEKRIFSRGLDLSALPGGKLSDGLSEADRRGAKSALVLHGQAGLLVNVPGRTVITAFAQQDLRQRVITDIDSVIILEE